MTEHRTINNIEHKQCSCCKVFKKLDQFQKRKSSKDGYRDKCTDCIDIVRKQWQQKQQQQHLSITHKICTKCKQDKDISEYSLNSSSKDGYSYTCKDCDKKYRHDNKEQRQKYSIEYRERPETKEYLRDYYKQYKINNPDKIEQQNKKSLERYYNNREEILAKQKERYYNKNKEKIDLANEKRKIREQNKERKLLEKQKQQDLYNKGLKICNNCKEVKPLSEFYFCKTCLDGYNGQCKSCLALKDKIYKQNLTKEQKEQQKQRLKLYTIENKDRLKEYQKQYRIKNVEKIKQADRLRYSNNKLNKTMSCCLNKALKENKAERHWEDLVDYTLQELKAHLESQFTPEMSWNNYGTYWELDHIIPQNTFSFKTEKDKEFKICWSLMNLRPLEKIANRMRPKDGSDILEELKQQILTQFN